MGKDYARSDRIAEQIRRELAEILRLELKDPRIGGLVTLTDVEVTSDYSHAKVYFTLLGGEDKLEQTLQGLQRGAGFMRTQLAHRLKLRVMPQLHFVHDTSVERGMRLSQLIDQAVAEPSRQSEEE